MLPGLHGIALAAVWLSVAPQGPPPDTIALRADEAFDLAIEAAPSLDAHRRRTAAADALVRQSGAWANPVLSVAAENVGATRSITGVGGVQGLEGQAVIAGLLPIGGDREAARSAAEARFLEATSLESGAEGDVRLTVVRALAETIRDEERLRRAQAEATGLEALADALAAQAELGRASAGEAARAHLAMVSAYTVAAEVAVEAEASRERLALVLGLEPGTVVMVELPVCAVADIDRGGPLGSGESPEVLAAEARSRLAAAAVAQRRAARVPDLLPQVGVRRTAGVSALYLGFSLELPFFDRGGAAIDAAVAERAASEAEVERVERSVASRTAATRRGLEALEAVGARYTPEWAAALDQSVRSGEARYRLGEGTLTELLDGRRARLQALDDYERWRAELFTRRAELARLTGSVIDASTLCGAAIPPTTHGSEDGP